MFLGLSVIQLVLGGLAIASVGAGLWATANHLENEGERKTEQKYAPMVAQCRDVRGLFGGTHKASPAECAADMKQGVDAVAKNVTLQQDVARLALERQACNDAVARIARQGARAADLAAARKPADDVKIAETSVEKQSLIDSLPQREALGLEPTAKTCEQRLVVAEARLARRDALWQKVAKEQERDFPPTANKPRSDDVTIKAPAK